MAQSSGESLLSKISTLFDLRGDTDYTETEASIRKNAEFRSANAWTLVFAIFIASVGLNTNSTAVIIGAMLISPLMGAIVGAGYALGVNDFDLLRRSVRNLVIAMVISVLTSMLYFLLSPFNEPSAELLARTSPNFYDVLIATFGGAAGIVASSRKEKGNAIPGVAIATALMPPLCTVGFGVAHLNWNFVLGAFYLFLINSVFICFTSYVFVRYLRFPKVKWSHPEEQSRIDRWIMGTLTVVTVPSIVMAWLLWKESSFRLTAERFIETEARFKAVFVVEKKVNYSLRSKSIELTLMGDQLPEEKVNALKQRRFAYGLSDTEIVLHQVSLQDRFTAKQEADGYQKTILGLQSSLQRIEDRQKLEGDVLSELQALQLPIQSLSLDRGVVIWRALPSKEQKENLQRFLSTRLKNESLTLTHAKIF